MTSFRRRGEKATICLQEHVVIDMYPAPISLATSCGSSPMTPPLAWPPPTSPTTTRMGTISSEPKDPAQVPALRSRPPSCQRTSWTPKATRGRLQTADLRPPVAPAAPGQKGPPSSRTEPRAPWSTQAPESLGQGKDLKPMDHSGLSDTCVKLHLRPGARKVREVHPGLPTSCDHSWRWGLDWAGGTQGGPQMPLLLTAQAS
ncbi:double C2-like domain-containing protein beta isoform X3 [Piliocolobus tephrosceles]|uniref:double C2-like domain-containing protein beta isoform X3 n=1 Tax=Piliocolobus tephrosceles TaxID=591936 RepID=UPI000E6B48A0|nr:double C2-like domain-containing protein beta isoform X3 [Piliocolobus tephrosceles]